jgi:hypothetical protein
MLMPTSAISCSTGRRKPFVITRRACGLAICHWGRTSKGFSGVVTLTTGRFSAACTRTAYAGGVRVGSKRPNVYSIACCGSTPDDDLMLEAAIASHSDFIITFNKRDFPDSVRFGIRCLTPKEFLILLKELP